MKKILIALLVLVAIFLGVRGVLSRRGASYLQEIYQTFNTFEQGRAQAGLAEFDGGFSSAKAVVEINLSKPVKIAGFALKRSMRLAQKIDYGPIFVPQKQAGLIRVRMDEHLSEWLQPEEKERFLQRIPNDVTIDYAGILDWSHVYHEQAQSSRIVGEDPRRHEHFSIEPIRVQSAFSTRTLSGKGSMQSERIQLRAEGATGEKLEIAKARLDFWVDELLRKGPIFGGIRLQAGEVALKSVRSKRTIEARFSPLLNVALKRRSERLADLDLKLGLKALDEKTRKSGEGIAGLDLDLKLQAVGIKGLEALARLQRERGRLQEEMSQAVSRQDAVAMQKAILALSVLDDRWVELYNKLLIPGKTRLRVDVRLAAQQKSRLRLDLLYTGKSLQGNAMSAMISLVAHADRLAEGSFELELERKLAQRLYPQAVFVLDSMVSKNMAKLENGLYRLKGEIRDGKIVINGTRYAPQELIMLILM